MELHKEQPGNQIATISVYQLEYVVSGTPRSAASPENNVSREHGTFA